MGFFDRFKNVKKTDRDIEVVTREEPSVEMSLTDIIAHSWNSLDVDYLSPYLADDFRYNSAWISNTLSGKERYLDYLRGKFDTLKKTGSAPIVDTVIETGQLRPRLRQTSTGAESVLDFSEENGKITRMLMRPIAKVSVISRDDWGPFAQAYHNCISACCQVGSNSIADYFSFLPSSSHDFGWLQYGPVRPAFQDLCFTYLSNTYSILVALHGFSSADGKDDDRIVVFQQDYDNLLRESKKNNLTPCILPVAVRPGIPMLGGTHLINAITGDPIVIDRIRPSDRIPLSEWELNNLGVSFAINCLNKEGYQVKSYCDVVGLDPQIIFEKNGRTSYAIVRTVPAGRMDDKFVVNRNMLQRLKNLDGYFIDLHAFEVPYIKENGESNIPMNDFDYSFTELFRSELYAFNKFEMIEIKKAIQENGFIEVVDRDFNQV